MCGHARRSANGCNAAKARRGTVIEQIEKIIELFEQKQIDRRQLVRALVVAAAAVPSGTAEAATPLLTGSAINHVTLRVTDLQRSRAFYERVVGATVMYETDRLYDMRLSGGNSFISIAQDPAPRIDHLCVGIRNFDVDRAEAMLEKEFPDSQATATSTPPGATQPIKWRSINLRDPDGNRLQLSDVKFQLDGKH
jgi:catechol 2,3-dioxygenase-like lactoylglutathione lyase family enzyme